MVLGIEVPEGIAQGEFLACCIEIVLSTLGVRQMRSKRAGQRQICGDALANFFLEKLGFRTHTLFFAADGRGEVRQSC